MGVDKMQTIRKKNKILWRIAFLCFCIFLVFSKIVFTKWIWVVDTFIYKWMSRIQNDLLTFFMKYVTYLSSSLFILLLTILLLIIIKDKKKKIGILLNLSGIVFLNQILKRILKRPRPAVSLIPISGYSFPSGHAMVSLAFYGFLAILLLKACTSKKRKKIIQIGTTLLILLIGFSRIYLGVHYASDVIAGFFGATCYLLLFNKAYNTFKWKFNCLKLINSFKYAWKGIFSAFQSERNMKIHVSVMCLVILFGAVLKITLTEWVICIFCFSLVIGSEMLNTAIETVVDIAMPEKNKNAKLAKDIAAGSVLVFAMASLIIGILIFLPKFLVFIM